MRLLLVHAPVDLHGGVQVKPQMFDGVLAALAPHVTPKHLIISIAAGIQLNSIESQLPEGAHVVRCGFLSC